jgi:hypothetical protein
VRDLIAVAVVVLAFGGSGWIVLGPLPRWRQRLPKATLAAAGCGGILLSLFFFTLGAILVTTRYAIAISAIGLSIMLWTVAGNVLLSIGRADRGS